MSITNSSFEDSTKILNAQDISSSVGFFEGAEKLLEMRFAAEETNESSDSIGADQNSIPLQNSFSDNNGELQIGSGVSLKNPKAEIGNVNAYSLRAITKSEWADILGKYVNCYIMSCISNENLDAYLLSESSLFVYDTKFILKTCGTSKNLAILEPIIRLAKKKTLLTKVENVFYSHCGYSNPTTQPSPHKSFDEEVEYLNSMFANGSAYIIGTLNGYPWYLYTLDRPQTKEVPDQTLEVVMTKLPPEIMLHFWISTHPTAQEMVEAVGLDSLLSNFKLDLKAFEPCGFSLNGIDGEWYVSIHITPQNECSYVSFETNWPKEDYTNLACSILKIFDPKRVLITNFSNKCSLYPISILGLRHEQFDDYKLIDKQYCEFPNSYNVTLFTLTKILTTDTTQD